MSKALMKFKPGFVPQNPGFSEKFAYVDQSCRGRSGSLNPAWEEFQALGVEGYYEINASPRSETAEETMNRLFNPAYSEDVSDLQSKFRKMKELGKKGSTTPYNLYCDTTAFVHVKKYMRGPDEGKDIPKDRQFFYATRGPDDNIAKWKSRTDRDPCKGENGKDLDAFTHEPSNTLILCPSAFEKTPSLLCEETMKQERGTSIDHMMTIGSILYHELTHLRLGTEDWAYGFPDCASLAQRHPQKAVDNADSMMYFAMAMLYRKNAWYTGVARSLPRG
ncbi:hypothetical protein N7492_000183 [Penicillium capsulatum]|uniref:Lysine-specific metallo-endopeptidase domain-containing protein n=1 Tax=Penicillium capsulatum TaxID=69766 RepID=A0A9W9IRA5_9EURO|nr:hypothetical protein N7492_000183 [Penicillium capsulatum]KAJ6130752.1 hypothetical protein N7512_003532 [Penicillium capsulatum]